MPQPIKTRYGDMRFAKIISGISDRKENVRGGSVGILENGSWAYFPSGNPVEDPDDVRRILSEVNPGLIATFNEWWVRKEELEAAANDPVPRAIDITQEGRLVFKDDPEEEVIDAEALHAYFKTPGPVRELAFRLFVEAEARRTKAEEAMRGNLYDTLSPQKQEALAGAFKILPSDKKSSKVNA